MQLFIGKKDTTKRREMVDEARQVDEALAGRMGRFFGDVIILTPDETTLWEKRKGFDLDRATLHLVRSFKEGTKLQSSFGHTRIPDQNQEGYEYILKKLILDEQEAITAYEQAISTARAEGFNALIKPLELIQRQEIQHLNILKKRLFREQ